MEKKEMGLRWRRKRGLGEGGGGVEDEEKREVGERGSPKICFIFCQKNIFFALNKTRHHFIYFF